MWEEVRPGRRAGEVQTGDGAAGHGRGAHHQHVAHVCDAGRVQAQRLVERIRVLPSPRGGMESRKCRLRGGRGARGGGGASSVQREDQTGDVAAGYGRGARLEHVVHGCDAGRVEAQRLVERICVLPSPRGGMERRRHAGREVEGGRGAAAAAQAACRGRSRLEIRGRGMGAERTWNM